MFDGAGRDRFIDLGHGHLLVARAGAHGAPALRQRPPALGATFGTASASGAAAFLRAPEPMPVISIRVRLERKPACRR
jgi:hypothetical protein